MYKLTRTLSDNGRRSIVHLINQETGEDLVDSLSIQSILYSEGVHQPSEVVIRCCPHSLVLDMDIQASETEIQLEDPKEFGNDRR